MTVICQLHEADWLLSVSYMVQVIGICQSHKRQDDGYMSVTWGRLALICQLHGAGYRCLSVTWGRM